MIKISKKYKHYDFEKYLSHQYDLIKNILEYYGDLLYSVENSDKNPFILQMKILESNDDNRKQKQSDRDDNAICMMMVPMANHDKNGFFRDKMKRKLINI